ncbi:hypothetical protein [Shewanella baltica]|uniref:hypothetical protein n=1 Tax=Shewanella baltica TaxID=62322 RepID=UPI00217E3927|nr:hypothetical protein [Shewanella baltica]MCS6161884.1 hypothetical protein [Shewanella baltica]
MEDMTKLARSFREAIEVSNIAEELPIFEDFPKNCCEHTSVFLGFYVNLKFPDLEIDVISGRNESIHGIEYHLWLEISGKVFDLTLDQFDEYHKPIYCEKSHPTARIFIEENRVPIESYMPYYFDKVLEIPRFSKAISSVVCKLNMLVENTHNKSFNQD